MNEGRLTKAERDQLVADAVEYATDERVWSVVTRLAADATAWENVAKALQDDNPLP